MTRLWLKDYYLTYPEISVEDEVRSVLSHRRNFLTGPTRVILFSDVMQERWHHSGCRLGLLAGPGPETGRPDSDKIFH